MADIGDWSEGKFGTTRANRYVEQLIADCHAIGRGTALARSCRSYFLGDLPDDLCFARSGSHFIFFIEASGEVQIVDFLHQRSDVVGRLRRTTP